MRLPFGITLLLALLVSPPVRAASPSESPSRCVNPRDAHGHTGVLFTFLRHSPEPLAPLTLKDARLLLAAFDEVYGRQAPLAPMALPGLSRGADVGRQLRVSDGSGLNKLITKNP